MSSRPKIDRPAATVAAAFLVAAMLSGCSNPGLYLDRRDSIALGAGDAVATNAAMQMNDPWPPESGNTRLAANGQRMQSAVERYRTNNVTPPVDPMMMVVANPTPSTPQNGSSQNGAPANTAGASGASAAPGTSSGGTTGQ